MQKPFTLAVSWTRNGHLKVIQIHRLGCACFPEFLQNFSERQFLLSLCLVVFHALTLKLPI